jgi:type VI secretion system protein ImpG
VDVETTCLNRDLPHRLPFGGGQPALQLAGGMGPVGRITCLTAPTRTLRPAYGAGSRWRIVSHLSLGHESIAAGEGGAEALREILRLYNFSDSDDTRSMIEGVLDVDSRRVVGRVAGTSGGGICRGVEITLTFDQDRFSGSGLFLFASVLEEFLSLYASINSFTQLVARTRQRKEILRRWPPRSGGKPLL